MEGLEKVRRAFNRFQNSSNPVISLLRDLIWVAMVVGGIALSLYLVCGTWPAVVTVESESMVPHMNVGDLVFVVEENRLRSLQTWEGGKEDGYMAFGDFGDVVIYRPNGYDAVHPIIHRAMYRMENGEVRQIPIRVNNQVLVRNLTAPHAGYITKGDNNANIDQVGAISGLGPIEPVKDEWIVGKAFIAVPLLGYPALHLYEFAAIILAILLLHEIFLSSRGGEEQPRGERKKRQR
ncbi:MAG: S26 family signal peptidase [Methanomicrobiales archaeon]|nr:S26 family signal peptidase [Methanomicrobiales archaeon]